MNLHLKPFADWLAREAKNTANLLDSYRMKSWLEFQQVSEFERRELHLKRHSLVKRARDLEGALRLIEEFDDEG